MRRLASAVIAAALLASASSAWGHARSVSYATWSVDGERATIQLRISRLDENALESALRPTTTLADHVQSRVRLLARAAPCETVTGSWTKLTAASGWARFEWEVVCPSADELRVRSDLLFDVVPGHLHFARVVGDLQTPELVLDESRRAQAITGSTKPGTLATAKRFVQLGITHLLGGWDHVAFVLTLLLVAVSLRELVSAVSGFTIGHSLSLALAATGAINPDAVAVEALIGLSIVLVAVESVWIARSNPRRRALPIAAVAALLTCAAVCAFTGGVPAIAIVGIALFAGCYFAMLARATRTVALRWGVATLFGLIHGFGFASVLAELSGDGVSLVPLVSFNIGVELGQLAIVAVAWPLLVLARRRGHHMAVVGYGAAAAAALGAFWFASRAWFVG